MTTEETINAGLAALRAGDDARAETVLSALAANGHVEALSLRGLARAGLGSDLALQDLRRATELEPGEPRWWIHLGLGGMKLSVWGEAAHAFSQAIERGPSSAHKPLLLQRAEAEERSGDAIAALHSRESASTLGPMTPAEQYKLGLSQEAAMRYGPAKQTFVDLLAEAPQVPELALASARLARVHGQREEAEAILAKALEKHPQHVELLATHLEVSKSAQSTDFLERTVTDSAAGRSEKRRAAFALAGHYDQHQDHEKAWHFATLGNALYGRPDDPLAEERRRVEAATALFHQVEQNDKSDGITPVYLIGPPRSGGTVLQRILSAPEGHASLGERGALLSWFFSLRNNDVDVWQEHSASIAHSDIAGMMALAPSASVITDKTPHHAQCAGLIHKLHPNARFIDQRRNLFDVLVSIYLHPFKESFPFATRPKDIADYLVFRRRTVQSWINNGVPIDTMSYDEFAQQPASAAEALFSNLSWPWQDEYLAEYRGPATVKTFSIESSREAVSARFIGRSSAYRSFLKDLPDVFLELADAPSND
ncbi:MAG: sulfotransferase [Pseudomonadota bacterium]